MNITKHFQTILNIFLYFQRTSKETEEPETPQKKMYKCKIKGCNHAPFTNKHSLATHLMVTHKKEGSKYQICGKVMSKYHLSGHLDCHTLTKRFQCKEKLPRGVVCKRSYKEKSALIRHLRDKHMVQSLQGANVKITSIKKVDYETAGEYELEEEKEELRADKSMIWWGNLGKLFISRFGRV